MQVNNLRFLDNRNNQGEHMDLDLLRTVGRDGVSPMAILKSEILYINAVPESVDEFSNVVPAYTQIYLIQHDSSSSFTLESGELFDDVYDKLVTPPTP